MKEFRLAKVSVENVMRCKVFHLENGEGWKLLSLKGKNGAGKSSVLKGIVAALCGKRAIPPNVLREGARSWRSEVVLQTLDGTETLTVIAGGSDKGQPSLKVLDGDGKPLAAPQGVLDGIITGEQLDPLRLLEAKPREQQAMLLRALGSDFDVDEWESRHKQVYDRRTETNRQLKAATAQAEGLMSRAEAQVKAKAKAPDTTGITKGIEEASRHNAEIETVRDRIAVKEEEAESTKAEIRRLTAQLQKAKERLAGIEDEAARLRAKSAAMKPQDTLGLRDQLRYAQDHAALREKAISALGRWDDVDALAQDSQTLTEALVEFDVIREKALAAVKLPVEGLEFTEAGLRYHGRSLENESTGNSLAVAVALAAGMQPHFRFVAIDEASVLDADNWALLGRVAEEQEVDVLVLSVDHGQEGILIENGEQA